MLKLTQHYTEQEENIKAKRDKYFDFNSKLIQINFDNKAFSQEV